MKLVIQIPCWNEEASIAQTIQSLPASIPGIGQIEVLVIDDGSTDRSAEVSREAGATQIVSLPRHMGLAAAFSAGVKEAIDRDADILVNTDADLQYPSEFIPSIVQPILNNEADIAVGNRLAQKPPPFGWGKMLLERLGSWFVRNFSGVDVADAASGFRAFNREAMEFMFLHGKFSYTLESLVMAGMRQLRIHNVPIRTNEVRRSSRLFKTLRGYVVQSVVTVIRAYLTYHPLKFFTMVGFTFLSGAAIIGTRYLYFFFTSGGGGHIQSLILLSILALLGFLSLIVGMLGDVIAANRRLLEDIRKSHIQSGAE